MVDEVTVPSEPLQEQGPYGSPKFKTDVVGLPEGGTAGKVKSPVVPETEGAEFDPAVIAQTETFGPGIAAAKYRDAQEGTVSTVDSMAAAFRQHVMPTLVERMAKPGFENDTPIDINAFIEGVDEVLTENEREYLIKEGSKGEQSATYALGKIKEQRKYQEQMGANPTVAMAASFMDIAWLAGPTLFQGAKGVALGARALAGTGELSAAARAAGTFAFRGERALAAASTAAGMYGVESLREGPGIPEDEMLRNALIAGTLSGLLYRPGKPPIHDPDNPKADFKLALENKPRYKYDNETKSVKLIKDDDIVNPKEFKLNARTNTWEPLDKNGAPVYLTTEDALVLKDELITSNADKNGLGRKLQWNTHKTMSSFGPVGRKIANLLFDNNSDLSFHSIESVREASLNDLRNHQFVYEDILTQEMSAAGYGSFSRMLPWKAKQAYAAQLALEDGLMQELLRRDQLFRTGRDIGGTPSPGIVKMADAVGEFMRKARKEQALAGVEGAEFLKDNPGYFPRRMSSYNIDKLLDRFELAGLSREHGRVQIIDMLSRSLRQSSTMDAKTAKQVASAMYDRTVRKGYFEDAFIGSNAPAGQLAEFRDVLKSSGVPPEDVERALDVFRSNTNEAGRPGYMKSRLDLDYTAGMRIGDEFVSITELLDKRVSAQMETYGKNVATNVAFAGRGIKGESQLMSLREELLHDIRDPAKREKARELFDNSIAYFKGAPSGAKMNENMRLVLAYGRAMALQLAGLWQSTEYANIVGKWGLMKTLKHIIPMNGDLKRLVKGATKEEARSLSHVLSENSVQSMRVRPYLSMFEDGFALPESSAFHLASQPMNDVVPYVNGLRAIHHHQAVITANILTDTLYKATKGDAKAIASLERYGLKWEVIERLKTDIDTHGMLVDKWSDGIWEQVRPAFAKAMDDAVLKARLGDLPAFAAFDSVGKLLFTYRTFSLTAHNKLLAGGLERDGKGAVAMMLAFQLPLAILATKAQSVLRGEDIDEKTLIGRSLGQMGGIGLFSEAVRIATGDSRGVGAAYAIPVDRSVKLWGNMRKGDVPGSLNTLLTMTPVVAANPFIRSLSLLGEKAAKGQ